MSDPFGEFAGRDYFLNHAAQSNIETIKRLEHAAFRGNVARAMDALRSQDRIDYQAVKDVHLILFSDIYDGAGDDRRGDAAGTAVADGGISNLFSHPYDIELAVNHALERGHNTLLMRKKPGEVMGDMVHAHPFPVGNGKVMMIVHAELCRRAAIYIDWSQIERAAYLTALTSELNNPGKGRLDAYLSRFVRETTDDSDHGMMVLESVTNPKPEASQVSPPGVLIPAREVDVQITREDIEASARNNHWYERLRSSLDQIAHQVFRDPSSMLEATDRAAFNGRVGSNTVGDDLAADPHRFGEFRGKDGRHSGRQERQEHRNAVAMQYALRSQVREYIALVHSVREQIQHEKHDLARRGLQAVPMVSAPLSEAIRLGKKLSDELATELRNSLEAFNQRFGDDAAHLRTMVKFRPGLAERHGIDQITLQEARIAIRKLDKGLANLRDRDRS